MPQKSRLAGLLKHFAQGEGPHDVRRIRHPLPETLLLVACGTITNGDDYEAIAAWGAAHLDFLRRAPGGDGGAAGFLIWISSAGPV